MERPWFWWPIAGALFLGVIYSAGAFFYARQKSYPRKVPASGFNGIVRETAKFTLLGSFGGLAASAFAKDLAGVPFFADAMLSLIVVSLAATLLNYYVSAAVDNRTTDDGNAVKLPSPVWEVAYGLVFGLSLAVVVIALIMVIAISASV